MGTMAAKGEKFVVGWPAAMAWLAACPLENVAAAVVDVLRLDAVAAERVERQMRAGEYIPEIGALTRSEAIAVVERLCARA